MYCVGCAIAWAILLAIVAATHGTNLSAILLVFYGFVTSFRNTPEPLRDTSRRSFRATSPHPGLI
jgi:hypothetical protein